MSRKRKPRKETRPNPTALRLSEDAKDWLRTLSHYRREKTMVEVIEDLLEKDYFKKKERDPKGIRAAMRKAEEKPKKKRK